MPRSTGSPPRPRASPRPVKLEGQAEADGIRGQGARRSRVHDEEGPGVGKSTTRPPSWTPTSRSCPSWPGRSPEPLSKVDKIVIVGGDKELGTTKITAQVAQILAQMPEVRSR